MIADAQQKDEIVQKEVFGPVVSVTKFSSDDEAIRFANDVDYGSPRRSDYQREPGDERRPQTRFGTVWINDHLPW